MSWAKYLFAIALVGGIGIAAVLTLGGARISYVGADPDDCQWPMAGSVLAQANTTNCATAVSADTLDRLLPAWFFETDAEVTGAPATDEESIYFGDWNGWLYSLDREDGSERWQVQLPTSEFVYAGQITATPALAEINHTPAVIAASGRSVVALNTNDGSQIWATRLGDPDDSSDPIEVEAAPIVAGDVVLIPSDVHGASGYSSGLYALDRSDGSVRWVFDPETSVSNPVEAGGCGGIWGTPAVDLDSALVVVGTANCNNDESWTEASEAIVGVDLGTGELKWSFQPHERGNDHDWDFAGAPNLFEIDGRPVASLGNKDGWLYTVSRDNGELIWKAEAQRPAGTGDGFAFGGFIGALALVEDKLIGGTAVGDCPCQHGFDAATGKLAWQNNDPTGTYSPAAGVTAGGGDLVFQTGIDQTLRAFDPVTGQTLWEQALRSISSSGASIAGDSIFIGTGFREPGASASGGGGVQAFRVFEAPEDAPVASTTTIPTGDAVTSLAPTLQPCVGSQCDMDFTLKTPPVGTDPSISVQFLADPFEFTVDATDLGDPLDWLDPDGAAYADGATTYMAFITPRDDNPGVGSILCTFGGAASPSADSAPLGCMATEIEIPAEEWTRISILAVADADTPPTLQEGFDRLVTTMSLEPPLKPSE